MYVLSEHRNRLHFLSTGVALLLVLFPAWLGVHSIAPQPVADVKAAAEARQSALRIVGLLGGAATALATDGRYVYAAVGLQLLVYDASAAGPLAVVGRLAPLPDDAFKIAVRDSVVFIGFKERSVVRVNVQNPTRPILLDETVMPLLLDFDVGDGVLFAVLDNKLHAFEARGQAPLRTMGAIGDPGLGVRYVAVDGERVYVAGTDQMHWIHLLLPANGTWRATGRIPIPLPAFGISAAAHRLVGIGGVTRRVAQLWSWLVDQPADPPGLGSTMLAKFPVSARVVGATALVGLSDASVPDIPGSPSPPRLEFGQFAIADLTDAHEPRLRAILDTPDIVVDAVQVGNLAYLAQYQNGPRLVDVTDPSVPFDGPEVATLGAARRVAVADGYAYVLSSYMERLRRLVAVDLRQPGAPVAVSSEAIPQSEVGGRIAVVGDRVYVFATDFLSETHIARYDRRRPDRLRPIDSVALTPPVFDVLMDRDHVYAWTGLAIEVLDLAVRPPATLAQIPISGTFASMSLSADRLFVSQVCCTIDGDAGDYLTVFDISNASRPTQLGQLRLASHIANERPSPLKFATDRLGVVITSNMELVTVDIADPRQLRILGRTNLPTRYPQLAATDRHALLYSFFLTPPAIVDFSDPTAPRVVGQLDRDLSVMEATVVNGRFVLAAENAGLVVLEPELVEAATPVPTPTPAPDLDFDRQAYLPWLYVRLPYYAPLRSQP